MSNLGIGLVAAIHAADAPQRLGQYEFDTEINGIHVTITYDVDGQYRDNHGEFPDDAPIVEPVSLHVGNVDITSWIEFFGMIVPDACDQDFAEREGDV
jgi:hypothetical protein